MKNNILLITIVVALLMVTILVGSPIKDNVEIVKCLLVFVAMIYIIKKLKKKTPIITNKMDIFVIVLMFSCYVPLIFNTYASLEDTIVNILSYTSLVAVYFIGKEVSKKEKNWFVIRNVLIISGIIFFVLGIDNLTSNVFGNVLEEFGVLSYRNGEERLISNFGYANSIGIIMASMYLIAINTFAKEKNRKLGTILGGTSIFFLSGLLLSESKGSILFLGIIYVVHFLLNKKAKNKAQIIVATVVSVISSFIYYVLFSKFKSNEIVIWVSLIVLYVLTIVVLALSKKVTKFIQKSTYKIDIKKTLLSLVVLVLVVAIIFLILLKFTSSLVLYTGEERGEVRRIIRGIKPNSTYNISFDIEAKSDIENEKVYEISIDEENKYDQVIAEHKIYLGNYKGTKEINIYTDEDTNKLTIRYNKLEICNGELTINKLVINEKEIPVNYKLVPIDLVSNIQSITIGNKNVWERGVFILDGIKLASRNWLTGIGGNGWEHCYKSVQSYSYDARYSHCYLITLWIENGILGVIAFLGIVVLLIKALYINRKDNKCVITGLIILLILLHSMMDFDMEFYCIEIFVFLGLGIISRYEIEDKKQNKMLNNILSIVLIIIFILSGIENVKIIYVDSKLEQVDSVELEKLEKILPYSLEIKERRLLIFNENEDLDKKVETLENILNIEKYYDTTVWYKEMSDIGLKEIKKR